MIEAVERCVRARALGCEMTLICGGLNSVRDAEYIAKFDKGWKMFPDIYSVNGVPNAELQDLAELGFNLVTFHIFEKAALYGMMLYGTKNAAAGNTVFSENHDLNGTVTRDELNKALKMNPEEWTVREKNFMNI
jgi:hypothetical protein